MKHVTTEQQTTARYYSRPLTRLGYLLVMRRSQHFGYYDDRHCTEPAAQEKFHQEFARLLQLKPGMKVLDAGCGQGVVACHLAASAEIEVTGITITHHEITSSQRRARKLGVASKTAFLFADYADMPFPDNYFDRVYTTESLSHAPDVERVLREFHRVLKPNGMLVCAEYEMDYKNSAHGAKRWRNL
ncbi:methyltransferase domain-containing protein [Candidatus Saccharibacteria bacterium]|nr:methyltransferase domain-containing protein [Candidatus Saccharibacteria bacterium]